jgi:subtilisin-like proprotein convertase family protein
MSFPKAIITKPLLISDSEYNDLGLNINLVGYDSFNQVAENTKQHVSPMLLNWVEPYEISGVRKTLFYTEVNTNFQVGDRVYIVNGNYDNDSLIKKDKYKKGRDGYKVLKIEQCKVVLDIDYTGVLPYNDDSLDDYIKVYYIDNIESFVSANRQITTRGGKFDYKFNYYQNNIAFIDKDLKGIDGWGLNAGVSGTPGFFVREDKQGWSKISDEIVYLGSFSVALSPTYTNNGKIRIMDGSFTYNGIQFKEGFVYRWNVGPTSSEWQADPSCSPPIITKANFRNGTFNGTFNNGLYGTQQSKLDWVGKGTWNGGSMLNTSWKSGNINSKLSFVSTYKAIFDEYGIPFQKSYTSNNGGFGFNYIFDSEIEKSVVNNGNFYNTSFNQPSATFSVVENHILSITQSFENHIIKAKFDFCNFSNILIDGGELKNTRSFNSRFVNVKSINSYFEQSVLKDSTYVSDKIVKILGYDEWNMSEYFSVASGEFSSIKDVNSKIYKFYISKENFKRLKSEDTFYIKDLKIKNSPTLTNFFDTKFRLTSWTEFYDDYSTLGKPITGVDQYSFYKRGYECSAFLSTPEENSHIINSYEDFYSVSGATTSEYKTTLSGINKNAAYSIDIIVSRHDLLNKNQSLDTTSEWESSNPKNYNYDSNVILGTNSLPQFLGSNIDIKDAYILDSDFNSGIIETSDWNSGHHINYNNDVVITSVTSSGIYNLEIDNYNDYLIAKTNTNLNYPEKIGKKIISKGDIVFLNSIDYDTRGMVTKVTILATGSGYTSSITPVSLINTKVNSLTMSNTGTYYTTGLNFATSKINGNGTGLTLDIIANNIGSVIGITYSAPLSGGGSYSMSLFSSVSTNTGPIATSFSTDFSILPSSYVSVILTDDILGTVTGRTRVQNGGFNATYSTFGPPMTALANGATGVGAIFLTGPLSVSENGATSSPVSWGTGLTLDYKTSTNGSITYLKVNESGSGYEIGQIFKIQGGNATFSIVSVSKGEIISYKINNPGEDYLNGDVLNIINPYKTNSKFNNGLTASVVVTSITASNYDKKGLYLNILANSGGITDINIDKPGLYYGAGEIFTINDGNLNALVKIESVTGSLVRLNDTYKVIENENGTLTLKDLGTKNIVAGLTAYGIFYTKDAKNRWGYISKTKIDRTKIKSGIFKRPYITNSLIRYIDYDSNDRDFTNNVKIKNMLISDALFSNNSNILSSATYLYSNIVGGTDIWNDGIINKSVINGLTFSKGTVKQSTWINGNFTGGIFYNSKSFDATPTDIRPNFLSDRVRSHYMIGLIGPTLSNNRYSWRNGNFSGGQFYKSDWESGVFNDGLFFYSKFYGGTINGGKIGTKSVSATDTKIYNALINYTTVDNANVYSEDTSYTGLSNSNIIWMNGVFNAGIFGSNNDDMLGTTVSNISYSTPFGSLPIADFKITTTNQFVNDTDPILGDFEIDAKISLKHTYLGDLVISLRAPNGKILNIKKRYSCGSNDNLTSTTFTSDSSKSSIEIGTPPYTGEFKFDALLNQGVYYDLNNKLLPNISYSDTGNIIPEVLDYRSFPPSPTYEGDRYLVIATASDPNWTTGSSKDWAAFVGNIVEKSTSGTWELYSVKNNDKLFIKNRSEYLKYISISTFRGWAKSYHSNTTKISELLNEDKTVTGNWTLMVMDCAAADSGFIESFELSFTYKTNYIIKSFKNYAEWNNGIFNGGQFIDLGVWKNGKFNGGKFISTYGYEKSGSYLSPSENILEYSWQNGEFNAGEFGNESLLSNSTWYNGEFNGGTFKGKLWNNGIFTYGEFKGGSSVPAIGNGIKSVNAQAFVESFKDSYYGVWRNGVVSNKKDDFVTDKKIFTAPVRAMSPIKLGQSAKFTNMLWISGTFNHPLGEMKNSVWLNGLFKIGNFQSSAFNPYVKRKSDILEFVKDDSCIWENGKFIDSEFHMSKWKYGQFISGTAVGMIWQNGISNYMNAYNIFWENGVWRNGNWYGSNFEYRGYVEDGFTKEIINRGIEWSGTSSCHIWNLFETDVDSRVNITTTSILKDTTQGGDSFTTTNTDDAGYINPSISGLIIEKLSATKIKVTFDITSNGGTNVTEAGIIYTTNTNKVDADTNLPTMIVSNQSGTALPGTTIVKSVSILTTIPLVFTIEVTSLSSTKWYSLQGYAINQTSNSIGPALTPTTEVFQTVQANTVTVTGLPTIVQTNGEIYTSSGTNVYRQGVIKDITINANYVVNGTCPEPTEKGILYSTNINPPINYSTSTRIIGSTSPGGTFTSVIPKGSIQPNTTYYLKAYTKNSGGVGYGPLLTITSGVDIPIVGLDPDTTLFLRGNVSDSGGSTNLERGFIISSTTLMTNIIRDAIPVNITNTSNITTAFRLIVDSGQSTGIFSKQISTIRDLTPGGTYYARAYTYNTSYVLPNCNAFAYSVDPGGQQTFIAPSTPPGIITLTPYSTTHDSSILRGTIGIPNGAPVTGSGFVYTTNSSYIYPDPITITSNTIYSGKIEQNAILSGNFEMTVTALSSGQKYYFKAYAKNSAGAGYASQQFDFLTLAKVSLALTSSYTTIIPLITLISAIVPGNRGIIWNTLDANLNINIPTAPGTSGITTDITTTSSSATSLIPNTKYYLVAYVTNTTGTYYTTSMPKVTLPSFVASVPNTTTESSRSVSIETGLAGTIIIQGSEIVTKGIAYSSNNSTWTNLPSVDTNLNNYITTISGLSTGTKYYFKPYVTNSEGIGYGIQSEFTTLVELTLPDTTYIKYESSKIHVGENAAFANRYVQITNNGSESITEYGLCYTTDGSIPTDQNTIVSSTGNVTKFYNSINVTPTTTVTTYKIRAYVKNAGGTAYSQTTIQFVISTTANTGPTIIP